MREAVGVSSDQAEAGIGGMSWKFIREVNSWSDFVAVMKLLRQEQRGKASSIRCLRLRQHTITRSTSISLRQKSG